MDWTQSSPKRLFMKKVRFSHHRLFGNEFRRNLNGLDLRSRHHHPISCSSLVIAGGNCAIDTNQASSQTLRERFFQVPFELPGLVIIHIHDLGTANFITLKRSNYMAEVTTSSNTVGIGNFFPLTSCLFILLNWKIYSLSYWTIHRKTFLNSSHDTVRSLQAHVRCSERYKWLLFLLQ